jgi:GLPGLI family protein
MKNIWFILLYASLIISASCGTDNNGFTEGTIEYNITYLNFEKDNLLINVLPETMITSFKNDNTATKIEGFFGIFKICNIYRSDNNTNITLLKMMDKKFIHQGEVKNSSHNYKGMTGMTIKYVDETKTIAGYKCFKALAYYPDTTKAPVILYYTKDINVKHPNITNPFSQIDGVLLEFQLEMSNIQMKLVATKVTNGAVSEEEFVAPPGFKNVSQEVMEQELNKLATEGQGQ